MDRKGREGTFNFLSRRLGGQPGAEHRAHGDSCPLPPRWRRPFLMTVKPIGRGQRVLCWKASVFECNELGADMRT